MLIFIQNIPIKFREIDLLDFMRFMAVKMKTGIFTQKKIAPPKKHQIVQLGEWRAIL